MNKFMCKQLLMLLPLLLAWETASNNMTTEELEYLFWHPTTGKDDMFHIMPMDENMDHIMVPTHVTKLVLLVHQRHKSLHMNLDFFWKLPHIKEMWITEEKSSLGICVSYDNFIYFSDTKNNDKFLTLKHVHFNVQIISESLPDVMRLLRRCNNLEVIDLAGSWLWRTDIFYKIFTSLSTKTLTGISLRQVLDFDSAANTNFTLNLTALFLPVKSQPIQYLDIGYNNIKLISGSITYLLKQLKIIVFSYNNLASSDSGNSRNGIFFFELFILHPKIKKVEARGQNLMFKDVTCGSPFPVRRKKRYAHDIRSGFNKCNATINTIFNLTKKVSCELKKCLLKYYHTESLLTYKDIPCEILPHFSELVKYEASECQGWIRFPIAPNLEAVDLSFYTQTFLHNYRRQDRQHICLQENKLQNLSMTHSGLVSQLDYDLSFSGLENLKRLNLESNKLNFNFSYSLFHSLPKLEELNLAGNYFSLKETKHVADVCPYLTKLDLSVNNLTHFDISTSLFTNLQFLENLNLAGNLLQQLNVNFSNIPQLIAINVSLNSIQYFGKTTLSSIKNHGNKTLQVDLRKNSLICGCIPEALETLELIKTSEMYNIHFVEKNSYTCTGEFGIQMLEEDISSLKNRCYPSNVISIVAITLANILGFVIIIACFVGYKFRYRIYTFYFHLKFVCMKSKFQNDLKYDTFICYSENDRFWVHDTLLKELEEEYGFKLCIHHRDFAAGASTADEIVANISKSRCFIAVFSKNFLNSHWCDWELQVAHRHFLKSQSKVIIIVLEKVNNTTRSRASSLVREMLDSRVYVEWPDKKPKKSAQNEGPEGELERINPTDTEMMVVEDRQKRRMNNRGSDRKVINERKKLFWAKLSNRLYDQTN